jgi:hypothetical protein
MNGFTSCFGLVVLNAAGPYRAGGRTRTALGLETAEVAVGWHPWAVGQLQHAGMSAVGDEVDSRLSKQEAR